MLRKRKGVPSRVPGEDVGQKAQRSMASMLLEGHVPGSYWREVVGDLAASGHEDMQTLEQKAGSRANVQRNVLRHFLKGSQWPELYWTPVLFVHPKTGKAVKLNFPVYLPHEMVHVLLASFKDKLHDMNGLDEAGRQQKSRMEHELHMEDGICMGLWSDSTPFTWDRKESIEVLSLSFPGLAGDLSGLRVPLAVWPKKWTGPATKSQILHILAWSFTWCAGGVHPALSHLGKPFSPEQQASRKPGGTPIGARFLLVEVRADWPALSSTLGFPQWNCRQGLCYKCMAHVDNFMDMDPEAPWRKQRLTHEEFLQHNTAPLSPLWHIPGLTTGNIRPDWLHVMDEGVAKEMLGGCLKLMVSKMKGVKKLKFEQINMHLKEWYSSEKAQYVHSKYDRLTPSMLQGLHVGTHAV